MKFNRKGAPKPYKHQLRAFDLSHDKKFYAFLMEQGTGKSKCLVENAVHAFDQAKIDGVLILAFKGQYHVWTGAQDAEDYLPDELKDMAPDERNEVLGQFRLHAPSRVRPQLNIVRFTGAKTKKEDARIRSLFEGDELRLDVLACSIESMASSLRAQKLAQHFLMTHKAMLVIDESSSVKNPKAKRTRAVMKLCRHSVMRRILNGTPVTQSPLDVWTQFHFLDSEILPFSSYWAFKNYYARLKQITVTGGHTFKKVVGYQNLEHLQKMIAPHSYRVTKDEALDLPPKVYQKFYVDMSKEQAKAYKDLKKNAVLELEAGGTVTAPMVMTRIMRLQQILCGYVTSDADEDGTVPPTWLMDNEHNPRLKALLTIVDQCTGKVIIWCRFRPALKSVVDALRKEYGAGTVVEYHGGVSDADRQDNIQSFQNPDSGVRFFVGNPQAAGMGLTLTAAGTVIYYQNDWNLLLRLQSEDRAHRIGQGKSVNYIDLVTRDTVDETVVKALRTKKELARQITGDQWKEWL